MPRFEAVADPNDPRVQPYHAVRERDLVGREGHFIAEGEVVLHQLLLSKRYRADSLLIDARRAAKLGDTLAPLGDDVPVYLAERAVMDGITGFPMHRGILALGRIPPPEDAATLLARCPAEAVVLVLAGIANHDNMGGIFRNAAAFGVSAVLLDHASCDPLYRKAIRVSVGGVLRVPWARLAKEAVIPSLLEAEGFETVALSPSAATPLHLYRRPPRVAALLGAEGPGLPAELLARVPGIGIAMADGFDSLNVATTSGILLHHLTRA